MLKLFRRLLASAAAGVAMHQVSQAAPPTAEPIVDAYSESEAQTIADHPMMAVAVRDEYLRNYSGPKMELSGDLLAKVRSSKRFRNAAVDATIAREEFDQFVQTRTR
jgi:hypothetical protein